MKVVSDYRRRHVPTGAFAADARAVAGASAKITLTGPCL